MASKAQAVILLSAAKKQLSGGRCKEAAETAKKALDAFSKVSDKQGIADAAQLAISALVDTLALGDAMSLATTQLAALKADKKSTACVKCAQAGVFLAQSKGKEALEAATEAQQAFEQLGEAKGLVEAKVLASKAALLSGNSTVALSVAEESVKLCIDAKDVSGEAASWAAVMAARFAGTSYDKGVSAAKAAAALYGQSGDKKGEALVLQKLAEACLEAGDANESLASVNRAFTLLDAKTNPQELASAVGTMVKAYIKLGQPGEAAKVGKKMSSMLKRAGAKQSTGLALQAVAEASAAAGALDEAVEAGQAATAVFEELGDTDLKAAAEAQTTKLSSAAAESASGEEDVKKTEAEIELEKALVFEVGKAITERDEKGFRAAYYKLEGLNHLTEEDVNEKLAYSWENDYEGVMSWIEKCLVAGDGDKLFVISGRQFYMGMRTYGMGYGPHYRLNHNVFSVYKPDLMDRHSFGNLNHYVEVRESDWDSRLAWHAGILDVALQVSSGLGLEPINGANPYLHGPDAPKMAVE
mmetsp:Transcript_155542/g.270590  ORF Transcript_155542/g.270590 Transcript_155542/m.270590 type:complete len:528 (+) Transcript_155542:151-1734(+)